MATFLQEFFGNDHQVEIEIGPERGTFLLAAAAAHPETNYVGIERSTARTRRLQAALSASKLDNVRLIHADANCVLTHCVAVASVAAYHIYFPDPWWKRRHHRRRLFTPAFAALLARTLAPSGTIHIVTDVDETFRLATATLSAIDSLRRDQRVPERPVRTAFETKAMRRSRRLYAATFHKRAVAGT